MLKITYNRSNLLYITILFFLVIFHIKDKIFVEILKVNLPGLALIITISALSFIYKLNLTIKIEKKFLLVFVALTVYSIFNYLYYGIGLKRFLMGYYYTFLFVPFYFLIYNINIPKKLYLKLFKTIFYFTLIIILIGWIQFFLGFHKPAGNYSLLRLVQSIYINWTQFFFMLGLSFIMSLTLYSISKHKVYIYLNIFIFLSIFATVSKKVLLSSLIIYIIYILMHYKSLTVRILYLLIFSIFFTVLMLLYGESILLRVNDMLFNYMDVDKMDTLARTAMMITSFQIAVEYFPFGSSLGTFGGTVAALDYSPLYYDYGLSQITGIQPPEVYDEVNYLSDFLWTHILAEFGFIGLLLYFYLYAYPMWMMFKIKNKSNTILSFSFFIYSIYIILFFEGLGSALPENASFIFISFILIILSYKYILKEKKYEDIVHYKHVSK